MLYKLSCSLIFVTLILLGTFTYVDVPFVSFLGPHLSNVNIVHEWSHITLGSYTTNFQIVAIILAALVLGPLWGTGTILLYLCLGFSGLPIFYYGGGLDYFSESTIMYLLSFVPSALLCGTLATHKSKNSVSVTQLFIASLLGLLVIHLV